MATAPQAGCLNPTSVPCSGLIAATLRLVPGQEGLGTCAYPATLISELSPTSAGRFMERLRVLFFSISINIHGSLHSHLLLTILFAKT